MAELSRQKSHLTRVMSMVMIIAVFLLMCSCSLESRIREITNDDYIDAPELTRLVVTAVKSENNLSDVYSQIPEYQRGDVSYSYLKEYTDILRRLSRVNGAIMSFRLLTDDQIASLLDEYTGEENSYDSLSERYGRLGCAEFLYNSEAKSPTYFFFSYDSNGHAVLSSSWISGVINIYNYADHYFTMLDEQNVEGVYTLLRPTYDSELYSDEVVYAKAQALVDYYLINVRSMPYQFEISSLSPISYDIVIPETVDPETESIEPHELSISTDDGTTFMINDSIEQPIDTSVSYVYRANTRLLRCGTNYTDSGLKSIMGKPMYTSRITNDDGDFMLVYYDGICLWFSIDNISENIWDGTLVKVKYYGQTYAAGPVIKVGAHVDSILVAYPFLDDADYDISYDTGSSIVRVVFDTDEEGIITEVLMTEE